MIRSVVWVIGIAWSCWISCSFSTVFDSIFVMCKIAVCVFFSVNGVPISIDEFNWVMVDLASVFIGMFKAVSSVWSLYNPEDITSCDMQWEVWFSPSEDSSEGGVWECPGEDSGFSSVFFHVG